MSLADLHKNPNDRDHRRGFFMPGADLLSDIRASGPIGHLSGSPIPGMACPKRPQHTWYVGAIAHGNPTAPLNQAVNGSPTRSGYTPDFELFPPATGCCRFLTVTDNHQKARSRPLPASAVARRVGALRVLKDTTNFTGSLRAYPFPDGRRPPADDFGFPGITTGSLWEKKLPARPRPHRAGRRRNFGRPKFDHSRRAASPPHPFGLPRSTTNQSLPHGNAGLAEKVQTCTSGTV